MIDGSFFIVLICFALLWIYF